MLHVLRVFPGTSALTEDDLSRLGAEQNLNSRCDPPSISQSWPDACLLKVSLLRFLIRHKQNFISLDYVMKKLRRTPYRRGKLSR